MRKQTQIHNTINRSVADDVLKHKKMKLCLPDNNNTCLNPFFVNISRTTGNTAKIMENSPKGSRFPILNGIKPVSSRTYDAFRRKNYFLKFLHYLVAYVKTRFSRNNFVYQENCENYYTRSIIIPEQNKHCLVRMRVCVRELLTKNSEKI